MVNMSRCVRLSVASDDGFLFRGAPALCARSFVVLPPGRTVPLLPHEGDKLCEVHLSDSDEVITH